jgi:hypothetical protein
MQRGCERAPLLALPGGDWHAKAMRVGCAPRAPPYMTFVTARMRAGSAPRAPRWGRRTPPNPLHMMPAAGLMFRCMPPLCQGPDPYISAYIYLQACLYDLNPLIASCRLWCARRHAHQALGMRMHRIRDPRDAVPGRECRGRGRPLPLAAQANCIYSRRKRRVQGAGAPCRPPRRRTAPRSGCPPRRRMAIFIATHSDTLYIAICRCQGREWGSEIH